MTIKKGLPEIARIIMLITKSTCSERSYFRHASLGVCLPAKESAFSLVTVDVGANLKCGCTSMEDGEPAYKHRFQ